jgi:hypothetical protein
MDDTTAGRGRRRLVTLTVSLALAVAMGFAVAAANTPPNYRVVLTASTHILAGRNPYGAELGLDSYKYSPLGGLIMAPFIALPARAGIFLFVLSQTLLFFWGFWRWSRTAGHDLAASRKLQLVALGSVAFDLATSLQNCQVNAGIFALMLLGAADYAEGKWVRSGLAMSLATNLKLFPFTLALCLMAGLRARFWLSFLSGLALWLLLPASLLGLSTNQELHRQWVHRMASDRAGDFAMLDLGTFFEIHLGLSGLRYPVALIVGAGLGLLAFVLFQRGDDKRLDRFLVPLNALYVLLFSYLSESPTSVLAVAGIFLIGARAASGGPRARIYGCAFFVALALVPLAYSNLAPPALEEWARSVHLKTVGYAYVFLLNLWLLREYKPQVDGAR